MPLSLDIIVVFNHELLEDKIESLEYLCLFHYLICINDFEVLIPIFHMMIQTPSIFIQTFLKIGFDIPFFEVNLIINAPVPLFNPP